MQSVKEFEKFMESHRVPRWLDINNFDHVSNAIDSAICKAGKENKLPWIEAVVPFYLERDMISKICDAYTEKKVGWYSARGRVFVKEVPNKAYFETAVYTKFIFCKTEEIEEKLNKVYVTDFNKISWNYSHTH